MASSNSYMITNRATPGTTTFQDIKPLSGANASSLWWYMSPNPNDPTVANYSPQSSNPTTGPPPSFQTDLIAQLKALPKPQLALYIHGLGNTWSDAVNETGLLGQYLANAEFPGLVIGFSWPSYNEGDSAGAYASEYAFPPPGTSGTIRDNIGGSYESFGNLMSFLENMMAAVPGLTVSILCHSEGNYMLMTGLYGRTCVMVQQVILMAADTNNTALQTPVSSLVGQGSGITTNAQRVTVYYSANDPTLASSVLSFGSLLPFHNPEYGGRLGINGPSFNYGPQAPNVVGVDCSLVVSEQNIKNLEIGRASCRERV